MISATRLQRAVRPAARAFSSSASPSRILVTGGTGQIGMELVPYMRQLFGADTIVNSDIKAPVVATDRDSMARIVTEQGVDTIVHMASLLSAVGEANPSLALSVNTRGIQNVLELAKQYQLRVFAPSTIAVFGPSTPQEDTPDTTIMRPTTMYGLTKVHVELLGEYYYNKFGVDFRSVRYPGVISSEALPGGARQVHVFLNPDAKLPMMYMPDCLKATLGLINAPNDCLSQRTYNITAVSFTPEEIVASIQKVMPSFQCDYKPDFRQQIAETWPRSIDDSIARRDWNWQHDFDLDSMVEDMLVKLDAKLSKPEAVVEETA
ncbi:NAD(P)-binding domain [Phytophthora cactorum]|nr:NAD(P)-binding domain [Phytophthora cactorum]